MSAKQLGFGSSWRMMTRDKGWLKPVMVLTLVGLIPIVGQMAILGYAYEWARLTAWGVDAAPKQHDVDYGKVMTTGAKVFALSFLMNIVIGALSVVIPILGVGTIGVLGLFSPFAAAGALASGVALGTVAALIVSTLAATFISVCALRMTIYDRFGAGWRLDRVFQMIGRDFGGFMHAFLISLIANLLPFAFAMVAFVLGGVVLGVGAAGFGYGYTYYGWAASTAMAFALAAVVVVVIAAFAYGCLTVIAQLVSINAVGQWVQRFDVARWGTSADPLPAGVPHRGDDGPSSGSAAPLPPSGAASAEASTQQGAGYESAASAPTAAAEVAGAAVGAAAAGIAAAAVAENDAPPAAPAGDAAETAPLVPHGFDTGFDADAPTADDAAQTGVVPADEALTEALPAVPDEVAAQGAKADAAVPAEVSDASSADDVAPTTVLPVSDGGAEDDPDLILPDTADRKDE